MAEQGLHSDQAYLLLLTPPQQGVGWGCMRNWEGTAAPMGQCDNPYRNGIKLWGIRETTQVQQVDPMILEVFESFCGSVKGKLLNMVRKGGTPIFWRRWNEAEHLLLLSNF